ncbi:MAG: MBL fold metallo-hydrolase [Clostridiales bacterium]|nr:MBL fold metallo-hydrolase [Clostridiales bacterium]
MNVRILGYSGGYPGPGIPTSGYLLSFNRKNILIDCGSGVLSELEKIIPAECLDMIIITHFHHDHFSDMKVLRYALAMKSKHGQEISPIPVYVPKSPSEFYDDISSDPFFAVSNIDETVWIHFSDADISFHPTVHSVECYGVRVERKGVVFSYSSDSTLERSLFGFLKDSDLSILDCGGLEADEDKDKKHMTPTDCFRLYNDFNMKRVVLSHLIPYHRVSDIMAEADSLGEWPFELAEMGKTYIIDK